ncbi:unnamed protein product [Nesidiocoris tenuis]|uniref:Uncharacterized protein n=2 Tax=Nesidiocoris tenuis TaxID=355587 RepID=A0A6H5HJB9_9HEMI|nr:syntaxin 8 [Nesidiocoris tenuis]CAB0017208.1 unnamed protein product [Nesidiocoris tenuis]
MALVDTGSDLWLVEYESCEKLYCDILRRLGERDAQPRGSNGFNTASASVRILLSQFNIELSQLEDRLKASPHITYGERERRQRLVEDLQSKFIHMTKLHNSVPNQFERRELFSGSSWQNYSEDDSDAPLLGANLSVDQMKEQQRRILAEQDRGLENLSDIIGRQKNISLAISNEVGAQNDIIDDIGARMEATTSGIRNTTANVTLVSREDSTWVYWMIILILFLCIVGVAI